MILTDLEKKVRGRLWSTTTTISKTAVNVQQPLHDRFIRFWPWPFGKMEKVTIADTIDQSDIAKTFYAAAVDEDKRLLYVSMTRARDLLILARGGEDSEESWIKTIDADWLQGEDDATELILPSGEAIPYQGWVLEPLDGGVNNETIGQPINWFKELITSGDIRPPLKFTPSSVEQQICTIEESIALGSRMTLKPGVDMAQLGTAVHGCIGASFTDPGAPLNVEEIEVMLQRMGVGSAVQTQELLGQIAVFIAWIKARWPEAVPYAEIPTEMQMPNGQLLQGRIDLLLKVKGGWILIDHKSNPGGSDRWEAVAQENVGQLVAYKNAVEHASGEKVLESWLFLPIGAVALRMS